MSVQFQSCITYNKHNKIQLNQIIKQINYLSQQKCQQNLRWSKIKLRLNKHKNIPQKQYQQKIFNRNSHSSQPKQNPLQDLKNSQNQKIDNTVVSLSDNLSQQPYKLLSNESEKLLQNMNKNEHQEKLQMQNEKLKKQINNLQKRKEYLQGLIESMTKQYTNQKLGFLQKIQMLVQENKLLKEQNQKTQLMKLEESEEYERVIKELIFQRQIYRLKTIKNKTKKQKEIQNLLMHTKKNQNKLQIKITDYQ